MVDTPTSGLRNHPPRTAPTIPTTTLRTIPCCPSVRMSLLATHPISPPTTSQMMMFINVSPDEQPLREATWHPSLGLYVGSRTTAQSTWSSTVARPLPEPPPPCSPSCKLRRRSQTRAGTGTCVRGVMYGAAQRAAGVYTWQVVPLFVGHGTVSMPDAHDPRQNDVLAALSPAERGRLFPHLQLVAMPLGKVLYESGDVLRHVYFPTDCILSLLRVLEGRACAGM